MFPIFWNNPYLKSNGDLSTIGDEIGSGGGGILEPLTVTQNGTYTPSVGIAGYSRALVNVPNTYTASDEGKVVDNGELVSQTSQTINTNGDYDTTTVNDITVNVPAETIPKLTRAQWNALTVAQKKSYGELIIVDYNDGFFRGDYVFGEDYNNFMIFQLYDVTINDVYEENGIYYFDLTSTSTNDGAGIIVICNDATSNVKLTIVNSDVSLQYGICTNAGILPGTVTSGTGRVNYTNGGAGSTANRALDPLNQKIFFGQTSRITGNFVVSIEPITV